MMKGMEQSKSFRIVPRGRSGAIDSPPPEPCQLEKQFVSVFTAEDVVDVSRFQNQCQEYNQLIPSVSSNSDALPGLLASQYGADIQETIREINEIMTELGGRLNAEMQHLDSQLKSFRKAIYVEDGLYSRADLLCE